MFRAIMQLTLDLDLRRPDIEAMLVGMIGYPLARAIRRGARAAAGRSDHAHEVLEVAGFDPGSLSTLWAASTAGASSAGGEATLRQALWRATFDQLSLPFLDLCGS